jgi:hypothetical protein
LNDRVAFFTVSHKRKLCEIGRRIFFAVFFLGGSGHLCDFASESHVVTLIRAFQASDRPVAMVCNPPMTPRLLALIAGCRHGLGAQLAHMLDAAGYKARVLRDPHPIGETL